MKFNHERNARRKNCVFIKREEKQLAFLRIQESSEARPTTYHAGGRGSDPLRFALNSNSSTHRVGRQGEENGVILSVLKSSEARVTNYGG